MLTTLTTAWLAPLDATPSGSPAMDLWPVGSEWDVLRTPEWLGRPVLERLLAEPQDADLVGPVLWDRSSPALYWFLAPGATDSYPLQARLLARGTSLVVPISASDWGARVHWLHLPDREQLTGPAWLASALDTLHSAPAGRL